MKFIVKYSVFMVVILLLIGNGSVFAAHDEPIPLKGYDGEELIIKSQAPYSPKQTCGECHEYEAITNGYHFQMGRTDAEGEIVVSDTYDKKRPWLKSDGMFGKW